MADKQPVATSLISPSVLSVHGKGDKSCVQVVIETARGTRNKMAFNEELGAFCLKKVLPEGMTFPYDFGFVPSTLAEDGDPLDALVLMDEAGTMGCVVSCRIVGVILGEQTKKKETARNDRLIVAAIPSHTHGDVKRLDDLNDTMLEELQQFFVNYHAAHGEKFRTLGCKGPKKARQLVDAAARRWRKERDRRAGR